MSAPRVGRFHVVTDETVQRRFSHEQLALAAVAGGADVVQYREKRPLPVARRIATARGIVVAIAAGRACCIVNDDVDVARSSAAAGVHLGPGDPSPLEARRRWSEAGWIGATANDLVAALRAAAGPVDYLGVGPVFATASKANPAPPLGLQGLAEIVAAVDKPVIAIGGIQASNVAEVLCTGAWGVAVLSAVVAQADPCEAARLVRAEVDRWITREARA